MTRGGALLVVASPFDAAARAFVERYASAGAVLLTPRDLSREGWRFRLGEVEGATMVASGRRVGAGDIRGVLTRLPAVSEEDLPHIAAEDRAYVAAEMTAFLLAVLAELSAERSVRVANRPTPLCLCGRYWREEKWRRAARSLGLAAPPMRRKAAPGAAREEEPAGAIVTIVGDSCIGAADAALAEGALALARAAGAELLAVAFDGPEAGAAVLRASPFVDLSDARIAAAAFALFDASDRRQEDGKAA